MRTALLIALAVLAIDGAWSRERQNLTLSYYGKVTTTEGARRDELRHFYCTVQAERAQHEIMRGRWVASRGCW